MLGSSGCCHHFLQRPLFPECTFSSKIFDILLFETITFPVNRSRIWPWTFSLDWCIQFLLLVANLHQKFFFLWSCWILIHRFIEDNVLLHVYLSKTDIDQFIANHNYRNSFVFYKNIFKHVLCCFYTNLQFWNPTSMSKMKGVAYGKQKYVLFASFENMEYKYVGRI